MSKNSRSHSTYIENATPILKFLEKNSSVTKYTLGIIKTKKPPSKTVSKPKIILKENSILIRVNSKFSNQEIYVYGNSLEEVYLSIKKSI